ncbi:MAG: AI-2E family transporter [Abditibacteriaceae bacterium]
MDNRTLDPIILRYLGYALVFCIAAYLLYMVRGVLPVFIIGAVLAYALEPVLKRLEKRGHSRRGAVGIVFLCFLLFLIVLGVMIIAAWQQIQSLVSNAPVLEQQAVGLIRHWQEHIESLRLPNELKTMIIQGAENFQSKAPQLIAGKLQSVVGWTFSSVGTLLVSVVVIPIITLWMMLEMKTIQRNSLLILPSEYRPEARAIVLDINEILGRYVRGQVIVCSTFGVMCVIGFGILGLIFHMQYGLALAVAGAILYIIPYFGISVVGFTAASLGYFTSTDPVLCATIAVGMCIAFNLVLDYGIAPRVLGEGLGLHPLMVLFALLAGAHAAGIIGMVLGVPIFASVRMIALRLFPRLDVAHSFAHATHKKVLADPPDAIADAENRAVSEEAT